MQRTVFREVWALDEELGDFHDAELLKTLLDNAHSFNRTLSIHLLNADLKIFDAQVLTELFPGDQNQVRKNTALLRLSPIIAHHRHLRDALPAHRYAHRHFQHYFIAVELRRRLRTDKSAAAELERHGLRPESDLPEYWELIARDADSVRRLLQIKQVWVKPEPLRRDQQFLAHSLRSLDLK